MLNKTYTSPFSHSLTPSYLIFAVVFSYTVCFVHCLVFNTHVNVYFRATVSAVSCLVVPAFICIDLLFSCALKLNDDDDDNVTDRQTDRQTDGARIR